MRNVFMMKKISLGFMGIILAASMAGCSTQSTSTTELTLTTTTDEGTKEYNYTSEINNGDFSESSTVTETPADDENDKISYEVTDGTLVVDAPSRDTDWWEVIPYETSTTLKEWSVSDGRYTGVIGALFSQGTGYVILGEYNAADSDPISYTIIQVDIEEYEIVSVGDHLMVDSLDEYFPVFDTAFMADDEKVDGIRLLAFYSDYEGIYLRLYDGENEAYVPYLAVPVTLDNADGSTTDAMEIQYGESSLYYFSENDRTYFMDNEDTYEVRELTEDEVDAVFQN